MILVSEGQSSEINKLVTLLKKKIIYKYEVCYLFLFILLIVVKADVYFPRMCVFALQNNPDH